MKKNSNKKTSTKKAKVNKSTSSEPKQTAKREGERLYEGTTKKMKNTNKVVVPVNVDQIIEELTPSKLQQAIILSEIIGTPVSRRRKRRGVGRE